METLVEAYQAQAGADRERRLVDGGAAPGLVLRERPGGGGSGDDHQQNRPALPDRAAVARTLQPPAGSAESIRKATRLAEQRLSDLGTERWAEEGYGRKSRRFSTLPWKPWSKLTRRKPATAAKAARQELAQSLGAGCVADERARKAGSSIGGSSRKRALSSDRQWS